MAKLSDIVDECLTVSTAFSEISSDTYNEIGAINFEDNDKSYPLFIFDKKNIFTTILTYKKSTNIPSKMGYSCQIHFMNTYTELEKTTVSLQTKQGALIDIANKYFAELKSRNESGANGFVLEDITFNSFDEEHNGRVVQLSYNIEFITYLEDCSLGSFDYAGIFDNTFDNTFN